MHLSLGVGLSLVCETGWNVFLKRCAKNKTLKIFSLQLQTGPAGVPSGQCDVVGR